MDLLFCHRGILSTLMVHGRISNALLAATLQMEENRLWSIKMKLDVSTALKSRGEKMLFLGHFVVVNWSEQLAVMQVMELLFSFHLRGLCACVSKQKGGCVCGGGWGSQCCWIWERGTTGAKSAQWWSEWRKHHDRAQRQELSWCETFFQTSVGSIY